MEYVNKKLIEERHLSYDLVLPSEIVKKYPFMKDFLFWVNFRGNKTVCLRFKDRPERYRIRLFTDDYDYAIDIDGTGEKAGNPYIGCVFTCRKERPMETWTRGNDLADGYGKDVINRIMMDIISNEAETVPVEGYDEDRKEDKNIDDDEL